MRVGKAFYRNLVYLAAAVSPPLRENMQVPRLHRNVDGAPAAGLTGLPDEPQPFKLVTAGFAHVQDPAGAGDLLEVGVDLEGPIDDVGLAVAAELYRLGKRLD